jgi:hypothetical protein
MKNPESFNQERFGIFFIQNEVRILNGWGILFELVLFSDEKRTKKIMA